MPNRFINFLQYTSCVLGIFIFASGWIGVSQEASAAERGDVMIVFDGSGSMRGKVNGTSKINIAKDALSKVITRWSDHNMNVGLIAYGHNRKKDCSDIETLVRPSRLDQEQFTSAIKGIKAVGNTPLSSAVKKAAEELDYTSRRATVILMSDGRENCNQDPCAMARALEESGAAFTAHVIALDVKKKDEKGLRCLAEETGGRYIRAKDAESLVDAFFEMGSAQPITFKAMHARSGRAVTGPVSWKITNDSTLVVRTTKVDELELASLGAGHYTVRAEGDGGQVETEIDILPGEPQLFKIRLEGAKGKVGLSGPENIKTLETFSVKWWGPNLIGDRVDFALLNKNNASPFIQSYRLRDYAQNNEGHLTFKAPLTPGQYELRYISGDDEQLLERHVVQVSGIGN